MTDNELLAARLERIISAEHVLAVTEKYAKKWHDLEAYRELDRAGYGTTFSAGRQTGYVEVISALLGVPYGQVHEMLRNHQL